MAMTSHSDVHVQVNVYLNLPIILNRQGHTIASLETSMSMIVYFQGEKGAKSILEILKRELTLAMQLTGEFKSIDAGNRKF